MTIFGVHSTRKLLACGAFFCPQCELDNLYEVRRARRWFHLCYIPVIPLGTHSGYVECQGCKSTFAESVLNADSAAPSDDIRAEYENALIQILAHMAWADGRIQPREIEAIYQTIDLYCLGEYSREDVEAAIDAVDDSYEDVFGVASRVSGSLNENGKKTVLKAVLSVAMANGDFAKEERDTLFAIGAGLGIRPAYTRGLLQDFLEGIAICRGKALH